MEIIYRSSIEPKIAFQFWNCADRLLMRLTMGNVFVHHSQLLTRVYSNLELLCAKHFGWNYLLLSEAPSAENLESSSEFRRDAHKRGKNKQFRRAARNFSECNKVLRFIIRIRNDCVVEDPEMYEHIVLCALCLLACMCASDWGKFSQSG